MNDYILFDLDGTLTDPKVGITTCVQYALKSFGIEEPDLDKLEPFIGPPLKDSFMEFYGLTESQSEEATEKYRERFQDIGIYENKIYKGMKELLKQCKKKGATLAVASSKPEIFVNRILEYFKIAQFFDVVVGSELDGSRTDKGEVIGETLKRLFKENDIEYDKVVMVGDRKFDIIGARQNKLVSIGVSYGYGEAEELKDAKADYIVRTVAELEELLLRGREKEKKRETNYPYKEETITKKMLNIAFPLAFYYILTDALRLILQYLMLSIVTKLPSQVANELVFTAPDNINALVFHGDITAFINGVSFLVAFIVVYKYMGKIELIQSKFNFDINNKVQTPDSKRNLAIVDKSLLVLMGVSLSIGLNFLFNLTELIKSSNEFSQVAQTQMSVSLFLGIILYGVLSPLAEELLFRGIIFNRLKKYMRMSLATVVSALIFGVYHGNVVQGVYGAIIGCLLAFVYDKSGNFTSPVLLHGIINVTAFLLTYFNVFQTGIYGYPVAMLTLVLGVVVSVLYWRKA